MPSYSVSFRLSSHSWRFILIIFHPYCLPYPFLLFHSPSLMPTPLRPTCCPRRPPSFPPWHSRCFRGSPLRVRCAGRSLFPFPFALFFHTGSHLFPLLLPPSCTLSQAAMSAGVRLERSDRFLAGLRQASATELLLLRKWAARDSARILETPPRRPSQIFSRGNIIKADASWPFLAIGSVFDVFRAPPPPPLHIPQSRGLKRDLGTSTIGCRDSPPKNSCDELITSVGRAW